MAKRRIRFKKDDWNTDHQNTLPRWLKRYLKRKLDELWSIYPPRRSAKDYAEDNGCQNCGQKVPRELLDVDHVVPKGKVPDKLTDWPAYILRYFAPLSGLQGLCKPCHKKKTADEKRRGAY